MAGTLDLPVGKEVHVCFHGIGAPRPNLPADEAPYWLPRDDFARFMDELRGWPRLRLSFDDGNASDVEVALPALRERGLDAAFYPLAGRLDQPGSLSSAQIRELAVAGMALGSHGWAHVPWARLSPSDDHREFVEARVALAEAAGQQVDTVALPFGSYNRRVLDQLRRAGYHEVASSDQVLAATGSWFTPRFTVRQGDTPQALRERVRVASGRLRGLALSLRVAAKRRR